MREYQVIFRAKNGKVLFDGTISAMNYQDALKIAIGFAASSDIDMEFVDGINILQYIYPENPAFCESCQE